MPQDSILAFLESISFDRAAVQFCERFDDKSRIWNFERHSHPYFELIFFVEIDDADARQDHKHRFKGCNDSAS